jgi:pyruvate dehydrogenase E2 component (dihydrolipoamide acetyltransferase)
MTDGTTILSALPDWPQVDFSEFGEVEIRPLGRIQQLTAKFLGRNWVAIPHVTHHDSIDVTDFETRRTAWNADNPDRKLTPVVPLIKALAATLAEFPQFNSSLDASGKNLVLKHYFHIGVAVDTPSGLLVPVLRDCDTKPPLILAEELSAISAKARAKGLSMAEMSGGSMSISSLGHIGGTAFTPIINAPEVAILGVTKLQWCATRSTDGGVAWKQMLPISLSYDHRVINGADAARFVVALGVQLGKVVFT